MNREQNLITAVALSLLISSVMVVMVGAQPPIPHTAEHIKEYSGDCASCHGTGKDDAPLLSDDHVRYGSVDCGACHSTTEVSELPPPSTIEVSELPPPLIPHVLAGWAECLACHKEWVPEDMESLDEVGYDHTGYTNDTCLSCHEVAQVLDETLPILTCQICHPQSSTAEHEHNRVDNRLPCTDCHLATGHYPHLEVDTLTSNEVCQRCHPDLVIHIAAGAPHSRVDCNACHVRDVTVVKNPQTQRIEMVISEAEREPPDRVDYMLMETQAACDRCHYADNDVGAASLDLPARSIVCFPCHEASPMAKRPLKDPLSLVAGLVFLVGLALGPSIWLRGRVGRERALPLGRKIGHILSGVIRLVFSYRILGVVLGFVLDGMLHRRVLKESKTRWIMHILMFWPFFLRFLIGIFTWVAAWLFPAAPLSRALVDKNFPPVAFANDFLALLIVIGACMAVTRRFILRVPQLLTSAQDIVAIALLGLIFVVGFILEGIRIVATGIPAEIAIYSFTGYLVSLPLSFLGLRWASLYPYLWYGHAGLVALFIAYLPFSKFFHILISPLIAAVNVPIERKAT